jgi:hypothetical protein
VLGFKGSLDEVRLWSEVRSAAELNSRRFVELDASSNKEDLELVFPIGSRIEVVMEDGPWADQVGSGLSLEYTGVLPRELVIPQASNHPKFDGNVDPRTEYAGAEELVMRYEDGPSFRDANAYLAHDGEFLYVGLEGVRLPAGGSPLSNNFLTIFLDPDGSSPRFDGELKRIRYRLNDGSATFSRLETEPFARWVEDPQLSVDFQALRGTERQGEFTSARDVEFRIRRSVMGDFHLDGFDRLAIVHENHGGPGGTSRAPNGALGSQPATWAEMRYTPRETGSLPHVDIEGIVVNPANGDGIEGVTVRLRGLNGEYAMRETNSAGRYSFVEYVGVGDPLRVVIDVPEGGQTGIPSVRSGGDVPTSISGAEVSYAGCEGEYCSYAHVVFRVRLPLPPTTILWFTPGEVYPEAVTRKFPDGKTAAGLPFHVEIANIHDDLTFYLLKDHCPNDPTVSPSCVEGVDYFRLEATRITPADGSPSYFELRIPGPSDGAPEVPFPGSYRLAAHDTWARPANNPTQPGSWRYAANRVAVVPPPYEDLHGFPFINIADGHDLTTYRAAFPDHVCNPLYMVGAWAYAPIYLSMAEGGQCVGMVVSANRLARGRSNLRPGSPLHTVHDDVLFGNGFRNADGFMGDGSWVPFPVRPSRYDVSNPCAPEPTNIWGRIKADHAVQFSSEYIGKLLEQFDLGEHGLVINHADVLEKIRFNPLRYQLCVRDGGKGHCVQPLRVIDTVIEEGVVQPHRHNIEVWDPNWPNRTRVIEVTIEPGQPGEYFYDAFGGGPWQGNWMFVYEIDPLWEGERHIPSIDTLAAALAQFGVTSIGQLLQLVISGDAEAMVSVPGHSAGWDGSGNFSETGEATLVIPPFNWLRTEEPPLGHLPANMIHRLEFGAPEVTVHNRGESYTFHSSHEGTMFQYFVNGAEDGTSDELAYLMEGELVTGVDFEAGGAGRSVNARVALCEDGGSYPAAMTFENLPVPLGTSVGISQLGNSAGVELRNDTGSSLSPLAKVIIPTSIQGGVEPEELDVPRTEVPAGASMRMMRAGGTGFEDLFIDIDHDRDGTPEFSYVFVGGNGEMVQTSPIFETRIEVTRVGSSVRITWRELPGWSLAFSADLENWSAVASVQIEDGMAVWSNDAMPEGGFFRLQRESPF